MMSPFDDTAGMASEQSSREVLNCPLVAALTPKMSDATIRAPSESAASQCARCHIVGACQRIRGVPLGMRRIHPECLDPKTSDRSVAADVLVREEPDEEDDEKGDGEEKEGEEEDDEGYSECPSSDP